MIRAHTVHQIHLEMSLTPRQAEWLKGLVQNVPPDVEADSELQTFRIDLFNELAREASRAGAPGSGKILPSVPPPPPPPAPHGGFAPVLPPPPPVQYPSSAKD